MDKYYCFNLMVEVLDTGFEELNEMLESRNKRMKLTVLLEEPGYRGTRSHRAS